MSLTLPKAGRETQNADDGLSDFWAFGQRWRLLERECDIDAAFVAGQLHWHGRDYVIVPQPDDAPAPGAAVRSSRGHVCPEVLAILTPRELQVCEMIAAGRCDKQIARSLGISGYTVREYVRRSFAKLHVSNRTAVLPRMLGIECDSV